MTKRLIDIAISRVLMNDGARTPGIDGMTKKDLSSKSARITFREAIGKELKDKSYRPSPVRRTYIPKPNGTMRPLGIPTIKDRVIQAMLALILEPIYEPHFHAHSYGFRPYRCTLHAALRIQDLTRVNKGTYRWVVEGDIKACFDAIDHQILITILRKRIKDGFVIRLIRDQLKAGIMEGEQFRVSDNGTPQGGIVSPLLANIYLSELDTFISDKYERYSTSQRQLLLHYEGKSIGTLTTARAEALSFIWKKGHATAKDFMRELGWKESKVSTQMKYLKENGWAKSKRIENPALNLTGGGRSHVRAYEVTPVGKRKYCESRRIKEKRNVLYPCFIIRYADDFVVMTKTRDDAVRAKKEIKQFLEKALKLTLSEEKTVVTHMEQGITFLGFEIKVHPNYRKGACLIAPSRDAVVDFKRKIRDFSRHAWRTGRDEGDITRLNHIITGWGNYYRSVSSSKVFRHIDHYIWHRVFKDTWKLQQQGRRRRYARRLHYLTNYLPYAKDIKRSNRRHKGVNYGKWADSNRTCAHILMRLTFLPIRYQHLHPQLDPFMQEERKQLDEDRRLRKLLNQAAQQLPVYNPDYGPEWLTVRIEALTRAEGKCVKCGKPLRTIRFTSDRLIGHHKVSLKKFRKSTEANLLDNVVPVCPKCHSEIEKSYDYSLHTSCLESRMR